MWHHLPAFLPLSPGHICGRNTSKSGKSPQHPVLLLPSQKEEMEPRRPHLGQNQDRKLSADIQWSPTRGEGFPRHPRPANPSPGDPLHPWVPEGLRVLWPLFHKRQQVRAGGQVRVGAAELLRVRLPRCEQSPPPNTRGGGLICLIGRQRIIPGCGGHGQPSGEPWECAMFLHPTHAAALLQPACRPCEARLPAMPVSTALVRAGADLGQFSCRQSPDLPCRPVQCTAVHSQGLGERGRGPYPRGDHTSLAARCTDIGWDGVVDPEPATGAVDGRLNGCCLWTWVSSSILGALSPPRPPASPLCRWTRGTAPASVLVTQGDLLCSGVGVVCRPESVLPPLSSSCPRRLWVLAVFLSTRLWKEELSSGVPGPSASCTGLSCLGTAVAGLRSSLIPRAWAGVPMTAIPALLTPLRLLPCTSAQVTLSPVVSGHWADMPSSSVP